jgi:hypothetical protein
MCRRVHFSELVAGKAPDFSLLSPAAASGTPAAI